MEILLRDLKAAVVISKTCVQIERRRYRLSLAIFTVCCQSRAIEVDSVAALAETHLDVGVITSLLALIFR
jgi:hypothetical protein